MLSWSETGSYTGNRCNLTHFRSIDSESLASKNNAGLKLRHNQSKQRHLNHQMALVLCYGVYNLIEIQPILLLILQKQLLINNGNRTEWTPIRSVIHASD